ESQSSSSSNQAYVALGFAGADEYQTQMKNASMKGRQRIVRAKALSICFTCLPQAIIVPGSNTFGGDSSSPNAPTNPSMPYSQTETQAASAIRRRETIAKRRIEAFIGMLHGRQVTVIVARLRLRNNASSRFGVPRRLYF